MPFTYDSQRQKIVIQEKLFSQPQKQNFSELYCLHSSFLIMDDPVLFSI